MTIKFENGTVTESFVNGTRMWKLYDKTGQFVGMYKSLPVAEAAYKANLTGDQPKFRLKDTVYSPAFGMGVVHKVTENWISVNFQSESSPTGRFSWFFYPDGRLIPGGLIILYHWDSERPETQWQPVKGETVWCWDSNYKAPLVGIYQGDGQAICFAGISRSWNCFAPFRNGKLPDIFQHLMNQKENER